MAFVREPSGNDELACKDVHPWVATELLGRLLVDRPDAAVGPHDVLHMPLSDRDRLIAELYRHCFGDRISSSVGCRACHQSFDLDFSLADMLSNVTASAVAARSNLVTSESAGVFTLSGGLRLRLPRVADEQAVVGMPADRALALLRERCILGSADGASADPESLRDRAEDALDVLAPVLSFEVSIACAQCGEAQAVEFEMVRFFLAALRRERAILLREVHCLATRYRWSHAEIMALPRSERRAYVGLVVAELQGPEA